MNRMIYRQLTHKQYKDINMNIKTDARIYAKHKDSQTYNA